jgi:hypothetical protein
MDCGLHPAYTGLSALPFFDTIDPASIDVILITQYHNITIAYYKASIWIMQLHSPTLSKKQHSKEKYT